MRSSPTSVIKKPNLSHYPCRSRHALLFRLESGLGTFTTTGTSYGWPCPQSQLVLQWCVRCICFAVVSLGSVCSFRWQDRHLFSRRQQCRPQALSGTSCSFFQMFLALPLRPALCGAFVCLLLQPASTEKTPVSQIHLSHHWLCSPTSLATPIICVSIPAPRIGGCEIIGWRKISFGRYQFKVRFWGVVCWILTCRGTAHFDAREVCKISQFIKCRQVCVVLMDVLGVGIVMQVMIMQVQ